MLAGITAASRFGLPLYLADLFRARVEQSPEAVAIIAPGRKPFTYRGLWRQMVEGETGRFTYE